MRKRKVTQLCRDGVLVENDEIGYGIDIRLTSKPVRSTNTKILKRICYASPLLLLTMLCSAGSIKFDLWGIISFTIAIFVAYLPLKKEGQVIIFNRYADKIEGLRKNVLFRDVESVKVDSLEVVVITKSKTEYLIMIGFSKEPTLRFARSIAAMMKARLEVVE